MSDTPRTCTKCHVVKSTSDYTIRLRDADGTPLKWYAQCRQCRSARITSAARSRSEAASARRDYVPVEPFCEWINARKEHYGGIEALARACGKTSARQLRRVLRETDRVSIYVVDEWLTGERSTRLDDLYPLNEDAEQVAA